MTHTAQGPDFYSELSPRPTGLLQSLEVRNYTKRGGGGTGKTSKFNEV